MTSFSVQFLGPDHTLFDLDRGIRESSFYANIHILPQQTQDFSAGRIRQQLGPQVRRPDGIRLFQHHCFPGTLMGTGHSERKGQHEGEQSQCRSEVGGGQSLLVGVGAPLVPFAEMKTYFGRNLLAEAISIYFFSAPQCPSSRRRVVTIFAPDRDPAGLDLRS
jgi:hypothetical protein